MWYSSYITGVFGPNTMHARPIKFWPSLSLVMGIVMAAVLLIPSNSHAQSQQPPATSISVSPPSYELSANPGNEITNTIRVNNPTNQQLEVSVSIRNFTALGEEGQVDLTEQDTTYSLARWITVSPESSAIQPQATREFTYTIRVPANAEPGGRFGSIVFKTSAKPLEGQSGVSIGQEVGSLVFLRISGDVQEKSSIAGFKSVNTVNQYKPVGFEVRVRNEGNVHVRPTGTITITNMFGKKVATVPLDARNVLPDAVRNMTAEWKGGNKLIFGRYTATASVVYGSDNRIVTASTTFWGFPYMIALVILGVLLLLGFGIYRGRKRIRLALRALSGKT